MTPKKTKNAPPVTEETSEPTEPEIPEEKPLTPDERLAQIEAKLNVADKNFQQIKEFLTMLEPLTHALEQNQQGQTPPQNTATAIMSALNSPITQALIGGGSPNPLQEKTEKVMNAILDKTLENVMNPPKSLIEKYLEEETAKKIAKTLANQE